MMSDKINPLRIILADDHALFRRGVKALLSSHPQYSIIGEAANGCEALELAQLTHPDVVLMDIDMPGMNGLKATRLIKASLPKTAVVILTVSDYESQLFEAIKCGASGYLLKNLEPDELYDMLEKLQQGEAAINGVLAAKILNEFSRLAQPGHPARTSDCLSERETAVLQRVARGEDNKAIAQALSIAPNTVKTHLSSIMEKLHLRNRIEVAVYAVGEGLVNYEQDCKSHFAD
jgi:DNA-binding NarL/FixJ family response regulator